MRASSQRVAALAGSSFAAMHCYGGLAAALCLLGVNCGAGLLGSAGVQIFAIGNIKPLLAIQLPSCFGQEEPRTCSQSAAESVTYVEICGESPPTSTVQTYWGSISELQGPTKGPGPLPLFPCCAQAPLNPSPPPTAPKISTQASSAACSR